MHRIFLSVAAVCFVAGTVCFGVLFVRVLSLIADLPAVEDGLRMVVPIQSWGWRFLGFYATGFMILFSVPERLQSPDAEAGAEGDLSLHHGREQNSDSSMSNRSPD